MQLPLSESGGGSGRVQLIPLSTCVCDVIYPTRLPVVFRRKGLASTRRITTHKHNRTIKTIPPDRIVLLLHQALVSIQDIVPVEYVAYDNLLCNYFMSTWSWDRRGEVLVTTDYSYN